jgi:hypothetical protein
MNGILLQKHINRTFLRFDLRMRQDIANRPCSIYLTGLPTVSPGAAGSGTKLLSL